MVARGADGAVAAVAACRRRALVCAPLPPEFDREGGSRRIYHFIDFLLEEGWSVTFICENAPADSWHLRHLRQRGVAAYVGFGGQAADVVSAGAFDLAIFAFWYVADRCADLVRNLSPHTRIVVETIDLHLLRNARRFLGDAGLIGGGLEPSFGSEVVGELNAYARADAVLTVSEKEAALINDMVARPSLARAVPDCDVIPPSPLPFERRRGILFVGNFRHPPNVDAVAFLCGDILPRLPESLLREHPLLVVGNGPSGPVREAVEAVPGGRLVGWVPSVVPYLHAARASVVPVRYGAGTKRKLLQAVLARTPSVTTTMGSEGLDVRDGVDVLIADDAPSFARAMERLLVDRRLWTALARKGRRRLLSRHGRKNVKRTFLEALEHVLARPALAASDAYRRGGVPAPEERRRREVEAVRRAAVEALPTGARLLVVSKGDPELLELPGCRVRHFPESETGGYAGYHPPDSKAATRHLEALRGDADYLVFPASAFWWLDYYRGFARHLEARFRRVWDDESCLIYSLRGNGDRRPAPGAAAPRSAPSALARRDDRSSRSGAGDPTRTARKGDGR